MNNPSNGIPLGAPAILVSPIVSTVSMGECVTPLEFYRRRREAESEAEYPAGHCLFESAGPESGTPQRSIVAGRSLMRLEIRGPEVRVQVLTPAAMPLLQALVDRMPEARVEGDSLNARYPYHHAIGGSDQERMKSAGVLDGLRTFASLIGDQPDTVHSEILPAGIYGALSYEIVDQFEEVGPRRLDPLDEPDASFVLVSDSIQFDHFAADGRGTVTVTTRPLPEESSEQAATRHQGYLDMLGLAHGEAMDSLVGDSELLPRLEPLPMPDESRCQIDVTDRSFLAGVARLQKEIGKGEIFQGVLSRGFTLTSDVDSLEVYSQLRRHNPSPYLFHMDLGEGSLFGASPETYLKVEGRDVEIRPIAGTVGRGYREDGSIDADTDNRLALQMLLDPKEQAEHAMLLDLARNDIARVSEPGTCRVVQQLGVEKFRHVQHLVSLVRGKLRADLDALHAYRAAANMGTLTGAPKLRATELIREIEPYARGFYGGAAGYLLADGSFDSCIVIRSLRHKSGTYHLRAGAGIVAASKPEHELEETAIKARACLEAVARADRSVMMGDTVSDPAAEPVVDAKPGVVS